VKPVAEVLKPVITSTYYKKIASEAVKTGVGIGSDMASGKTFKESAKDNLTRAKKESSMLLKNLLEEEMWMKIKLTHLYLRNEN